MAPPPLRQYASTPALPSGQVTEDTPADLLEGDMNLTVILPAGHHVTMKVDRSTPMMDLLIQVTTAHKINPAGHIIHVVSDSRLVTYKPSTPIGRLDSSVIQIVAKNKANEEARARRAHLVAQAVEKNIRLKPKEYVFKQQLVVNLPRSQLAVYRVPPKTRLDDVLEMVCRDKNIDPATHEIRHPVNVDEKLRGSCTLADYQLQAVTVVPRDYHAPPLSVTDLLTMSAISNHHHGNNHSSTDGSKKRGGLLSLFTRKPKSSTGGSSLSSGSAGERSISPARSDHYIDPHNDPPPSLHDPPPPLQHSNDPPPTLRHSTSTSQLPRPLSMHSTSAPPQPHPQPQRPLSVVIPPRTRKRQAPPPPPPVHSNGKDVSEVRNESVTSSHIQRSPQTSPAGSEVAGVTTNLTSVISTSSLSLASSRSKRKAPAPPQPPQPRPEPQPPIPEELEPPGPRSSTPDTPTGGLNGTPQTDQSGLQDETKANPISEPQEPSNSECEPRVHSPSPVEAPDIQQDPKTQRTSSPTSSVSSLSSADPTPAPTSPLLPQPDPPHASDHEVQTRTASFSSETSEERADVGGDEKETRGEDEKTSLVSEKEKRSEERDEKESENSWGNRSEEREEEKSSDISEEQIIEKGIAMLDSVLRTASDEMEGESDSSNSEDEADDENKRKESERREKESLLSTEQNSISSSSVTDLEGDVRIKEDREKRIEKEEIIEQNRIEPPIPPMRRDRSPYNKIQSQDTTTTPLIRKSSVSSVSSGDSSTRTARSQNSKEAESHLQSVLLQSNEKNISKQTQEQLVQETTTTDLDDNNITTEITWDYMLPDPPTPFQDGPTSKYTDNTSSLSSETTAESISTQSVPQVLIEELPTIQHKDSTVREPMNSQPESVNNVTNEVRKPALVRKEPERRGKDVVDSTSSASSRKSSFSSISSSSFQSDDQAKQRVINELKSAIKEVCSNEPRIVEMTPKTRGMETIMVMNKPIDTQKTYIAQPKPDSPSLGKDTSVLDRVTPVSTTSPEVEEYRVSESLPIRVKMPVQHTFIPRVVARVPPDPNIKPFIVKSKSIDSDSSYDSYTTTPDVDDSARSRSESNTSYESAPPPVPDAPIPTDSDLEVRGSRSSSDVSDGGKTRADSSLDTRKLKMAASSSIQNVSSGIKDTSSSDESRSKSSLRRQDSDSSLEYNRSRVMNFSISTYKSRAEETSYEKKIVKSDSFSQSSGQLSRTSSFSDQSKTELTKNESDSQGKSEIDSRKEPSVLLNKPTTTKKLPLTETSSGAPSVAQSTFLTRQRVFGKPSVPPKSSMYRMHSESSLPTVGHSVSRVNSLSERLGGLRGKGQFQVPDPPRPLRRAQRLDHQEPLARTSSMVNLSTPEFELRKAQSSQDISRGNNSNNEMPGMFGGMMGPGFMGPGNMMGPGGDAQLADEFMKLQQDFFKWQQQLLQNQHILHSRVAPLATNPPNLQSVGVMRDIMGGQGSSGDPGVTEARNTTLVERHGPVERVINITFEEGPAHTDETQLRTLPRMGHNVKDLTKDMSQLNTGNFPSEPQPRRWAGEPSVSVGSWSDRPSQPVSVHQDTDYTTSHQQPQFQQQPQSQFQQQPQPQFHQQPQFQQPQPQFQQQPQPQFQQQQQPQQQQPQPQFQQQPQQHFQPQQFQSLPQEQKDQFAQFLQQQPQRQWPPSQQQQQRQWPPQQQQQQEQQLKWQPPSQQPPSSWQQQQQQPSKPKPQPVQPQPPPQPKWSAKQPLDSSELENRTSFWQKMGKQQDGSEVETEPTRPPRRSPPQDTPRQTESSQGRTFDDQVNVNEPPRSYFYNGEPNAAPQGSGRAGPGQEGDSGNPRYTSVVTVTNDKPEAGKDKVRSVVQLNATNQGPTPGAPGQNRPAPVVRGFRQPGEDPAGQNAGNFPSRIFNNVSRNQRSSVSPPSVNGSSLVSEAPTAARLVAAVSQPPKAPSPSMTPAQTTSRPSPPRSSPSRASPLTNFQQRPSPPPASPPAAPPAPGPPPPPAPPMATPGPPPPPAPPGPPPPPAPPMAPPPPMVADGMRRTSTGKKIITAKGGPELDAREELMMAIKNHGGLKSLKRTRGEDFECQ